MLKAQPNQTVEQFIAFKEEIESLKYWKNLHKRNAVYYWLMTTDGLIKKTQRFTLDEISQIVLSASYTRQHAHRIKLDLKNCINLYKQAHKLN